MMSDSPTSVSCLIQGVDCGLPMSFVLSCTPPVTPGPEQEGEEELRWLAVPSAFTDEERRYAVPLPITAPLVLADPPTASSRLRNRGACKGCVLLTQRGECNFTQKLRRGQECGAAAVLVGNNDATNRHSVFAMHGPLPGGLGLDDEIPCAMVSHACYERLCSMLEGLPEGSALEVRVSSLGSSPSELSGLRRWEMGAAIRSATLMQDTAQLQALLDMDVRTHGRGNPAAAYNEADVDRGVTAVHVAVETGAADCLHLLLPCQPAIDKPRNDDFRPLHIAAERDAADLVEALLSWGCYVDAPHRLGWTALHFAAQKGAVAATRELIRCGATIDYRAADGSTPLLVAVLMGQVAMVEVLMEAGADRLLANRSGSHATSLAEKKGNVECLALLRSYQRDYPPVDEKGQGTYSSNDDHTHYRRNNSQEMQQQQHRHSLTSSSTGLAVRGGSPSCATPFWLLQEHDDDPPRVQHLSLASSPRQQASASSSCQAVLPTIIVPELRRLGVLPGNSSSSTSVGLSNLPWSSAPPVLQLSEEARFSLLDFLSHAQAGWTSGVPSLKFRQHLTVLELPESMRQDLWLAIITSRAGGRDEPAPPPGQGEKGEDPMLLLPPPPTSSYEHMTAAPPAGSSPGRVRSLYEDLERTKFSQYAQGEHMQRMKRLVLRWLDLEAHNEYKQGLTSLAAPFLEVFGPGGEDRALLCLSGMIEQHMRDVFKEGGATLERLHDRVRVLESLCVYWDPDLAVHLSSLDVIGELFCTPWLMTLFSDVLPMPHVIRLWDACLLLGRGFIPCFALAVLLQLRPDIMAADAQASVLVAFSQLNAEVTAIDLQACLTRAFKIYGKTPASLLRAWDGGGPCQAAIAACRNQPSPLMSGDPESPLALDYPPVLTADDVAELKPDVRVLDVRDRPASADKLLAIPNLPDGVVVVHMPYSGVRGHAEFCNGLSGLQVEMRPPPAVRGLAGKFHITVYADHAAEAKHVARMLAFSHTPFVSVLEPAPPLPPLPSLSPCPSPVVVDLEPSVPLYDSPSWRLYSPRASV